MCFVAEHFDEKMETSLHVEVRNAKGDEVVLDNDGTIPIQLSTSSVPSYLVSWPFLVAFTILFSVLLYLQYYYDLWDARVFVAFVIGRRISGSLRE